MSDLIEIVGHPCSLKVVDRISVSPGGDREFLCIPNAEEIQVRGSADGQTVALRTARAVVAMSEHYAHAVAAEPDYRDDGSIAVIDGDHDGIPLLPNDPTTDDLD